VGEGLIVVAFVGVAVLALLLFAWQFRRSDTLLERWAERNGYTLIEREYRWFARGPFFWTSSKGQTVYRVTVEDKAGRRRSGWVRCGGWFFGLLSDTAEVRWDD
jgi:hypothetical protein